jgi:cytoskeletal protein CcmA (bactofilin family)
MFAAKKQSIDPNSTDSLVGEGTVVEGKIASEASLRIEGHVHGEIVCSGDVTIGENGVVHSDITARNIVTAGVIQGTVTTKGKLTISPTGKVHGSIAVGSLSISEGGIFQGTSRMETKPHGGRDKEAEAIPLKGKSSAAV